jgi:sortase A
LLPEVYLQQYLKSVVLLTLKRHNSLVHTPLRRFNDILSVLVILAGLYIVVAPFLPQVERAINPPVPSKGVHATTKLVPSQNLLQIPRLGMVQLINTGHSTAELSKGVWLIPATSTPDHQSNTVMAGHRFTYAGPAVFYFLDKIQINDKIYVDWQRKEYTYKVAHIDVVPPSQTSVQLATPTPTLTLYTCTPLLTAKNRLVITSQLMGVRS